MGLFMAETSNYEQIDSQENVYLFFNAVTNNDINAVKNILQSSSEKLINIQDIRGNTALIIAASKQHTEIVDYLIAQKANVFIENNKNKSALIIADQNNSREIVKILLSKYSATNKDLYKRIGMHPMHLAVKHNCPDLFINKYLDQVSSPNLTTNKHQTSLFLAVKAGNRRIVEALVANESIDLEICPNKAEKHLRYVTPLILARYCKHHAKDVNKIILYQRIESLLIQGQAIQSITLASIINLLEFLIENLSKQETFYPAKTWRIKLNHLTDIKDFIDLAANSHIALQSNLNEDVLNLINRVCAISAPSFILSFFFRPQNNLNDFYLWSDLHVPELQFLDQPFNSIEEFHKNFDYVKRCVSAEKVLRTTPTTVLDELYSHTSASPTRMTASPIPIPAPYYISSNGF